MCQSKAAGGRRCNNYLMRGVHSAMNSLAAAITGLAPNQTQDICDDLIREGADLLAPTREEVDEFLHHQAFQVRHTLDLPESRRTVLLNRIREAIGRITPDGATFHAWKNLVAESWARVRRRAAAAFLAGALTFGVGACGNVPAQSVPEPAVTTPATATVPIESTTFAEDYAAPPRITVPAEVNRAHGAKDVQAAYQEVVNVIEDYTWQEDLVVERDGRTAADFDDIKQHMTADMAKDWDREVRKDLGSDEMNVAVQGLVYHDVYGDWTWRNDGQPNIIDTKITQAKAVPNADGRIAIKTTASGTLRIEKDGAPMLLTITKRQTWYLKDTGKGSNQRWLVDGAWSKIQVDPAVPDTAATP